MNRETLCRHLWVVLGCLLLTMVMPASVHAGDDELLIPMPGNTPSTRNAPPVDPEVILPMPGEGKGNGKPKPKKGPEIIPIPEEPASVPVTVEISPEPPPPPDVPPPPPTQAPTQTTTGPTSRPAPPVAPPAAPGGKEVLPAFPKDTSSAIFMLMKTWECKDYDGGTLLEHAVGVYGQEAEDKFALKGLTGLPKFNTTLKEEDVTLDELLDIMSNKHGFDWGVDIPGKIIYLYPTK